MHHHSTAIAVGLALALAVGIVVASTGLGADDGVPQHATATSLPPERPGLEAADFGLVDTAAASRDVAALQRAHAANPDSVRIALNLGDAWFAAGRYDEAAAAYADALERSPGHPTATVRMAMVWHARGDDARAVRLLERVVAEVPDHQEAHYRLAVVRFARQQVAGARAAWLRAAEIDPTSRLGRAAQGFVELLSDGGSVQSGS